MHKHSLPFSIAYTTVTVALTAAAAAGVRVSTEVWGIMVIVGIVHVHLILRTRRGA